MQYIHEKHAVKGALDKRKASATMHPYGGYTRGRADAWFDTLLTPGFDTNGDPKKVPNAEQLLVLQSVRKRVELEWWEAWQVVPKVRPRGGA